MPPKYVRFVLTSTRGCYRGTEGEVQHMSQKATVWRHKACNHCLQVFRLYRVNTQVDSQPFFTMAIHAIFAPESFQYRPRQMLKACLTRPEYAYETLAFGQMGLSQVCSLLLPWNCHLNFTVKRRRFELEGHVT